MKSFAIRLPFALVLLLAAFAATTGPQFAAAAPNTLLEQADYTFACPATDQTGWCTPEGALPDPAIWTANRVPAADSSTWCAGGSTSVAQCADSYWGLLLSDPGPAQLLYTHELDQLSGDPLAAAHYNTASFRVVSTADYVPDGPAWFADSVAWRMIFDDGWHRVELKLSRTTTGQRQVSIGNSAVQPFFFPWDNTMPNVYEIERHANGDFTVTVTNADPAHPDPIQTRHITAGMLPASHGTPAVAWGMAWEAAAGAGWHQAHVEVHRPTGSVSGRGSIDSPAGALDADPAAAGLAKFSVGAKFAKGIPSGQVAFDFKAGNLAFKSTRVDALRVTDTGAQIEGRGTVNGVGGYRFIVRVSDGQAAGGAGADTFHIRIWDPATYTGHNATYDNEPLLDPWSQDATWPLSGGSITLR